MAAIGSACLVIAFLTAVYAAGAGVYAGVTRNRNAAVSARRAIYCLARLMLLATAILEAAYLRTDLSFRSWPTTPRPTRRPSTRSPRCGRARRAR